MYPWIVFDVETKGNPGAAERLWKPPGNLTDPAKIAARKAEFIEKAALSPLTGSIVVIGLINSDGEEMYLEGTEREILNAFWGLVTDTENAVTKFVFWSGAGAASEAFDMDYIVTRSRLIGVKVPGTVRSGRFYGQRFVDLASEFLLYQSGEYLSLSNAAMLFGLFDDGNPAIPAVKPKNKESDEITGANFAANYQAGAERRAKAMAYLSNDLRLTFHIARAIL